MKCAMEQQVKQRFWACCSGRGHECRHGATALLQLEPAVATRDVRFIAWGFSREGIFENLLCHCPIHRPDPNRPVNCTPQCIADPVSLRRRLYRFHACAVMRFALRREDFDCSVVGRPISTWNHLRKFFTRSSQVSLLHCSRSSIGSRSFGIEPRLSERN